MAACLPLDKAGTSWVQIPLGESSRLVRQCPSRNRESRARGLAEGGGNLLQGYSGTTTQDRSQPDPYRAPQPSPPELRIVRGFFLGGLVHRLYCPLCAAAMVGRTNSKTGVIFAGCSRFPDCKGSRSLLPADLVSYDSPAMVEDEPPGQTPRGSGSEGCRGPAGLGPEFVGGQRVRQPLEPSSRSGPISAGDDPWWGDDEAALIAMEWDNYGAHSSD